MVYSFLLFFVFPIFFSILFSKMIMSHLWSYRPKERFSHFGFRQSIDCLTFFFCFFLGFLWFTQETNKVIKHILCFKQTNRKKNEENLFKKTKIQNRIFRCRKCNEILLSRKQKQKPYANLWNFTDFFFISSFLYSFSFERKKPT